MRPSEHIRSRQAREIRRAVRHSYRMDRPLNWQITIDYGWQDEGNELVPSKLHRDIRRRFWSWWDYKRKKGEVTGQIYDTVIWEAPNGKHHANWLIHIPPSHFDEAKTTIENRCEKVLGEFKFDVLHQQEIYNLNGLTAYLLKGTEPDYAKKVEIRPEYQGIVWCRRAVPSMALGRAARDRDWRAGNVVHTAKAKGVQMPREKRVLMLEQQATSR